jgi:hypothetical protein
MDAGWTAKDLENDEALEVDSSGRLVGAGNP